MKKIATILYILVTISGNLYALSAERCICQRLLIDLNWKFIQLDVKGAEEPKFNDSDWRTLNLPHDWSIEGEFREDAITKRPGGYLPKGIGWYRNRLKQNNYGNSPQCMIT